MKEKIYEEFNIKVKYLLYRKENISFFHDDQNYLICETDKENNDLIKLNEIVLYLENYGLYFHKLIEGKNGILFTYDNKKYVLMQTRMCYNRSITIAEIINLSRVPLKDEIFINPGIKLATKIDFIEQFLANYTKNITIDLAYYIGLCENAVTLYNLLEEKYFNKSFNHKRVYKDMKIIEFYNPLNIVVDYQTRDIAEYAKSLYFTENRNIFFECLNLFDQKEWITYFARLLYPSYYFDAFETSLTSKNDQEIKKISSKANSYEIILKNLYSELKKYINIPNIEWLNNIDNF